MTRPKHNLVYTGMYAVCIARWDACSRSWVRVTQILRLPFSLFLTKQVGFGFNNGRAQMLHHVSNPYLELWWKVRLPFTLPLLRSTTNARQEQLPVDWHLRLAAVFVQAT